MQELMKLYSSVHLKKKSNTSGQVNNIYMVRNKNMIFLKKHVTKQRGKFLNKLKTKGELLGELWQIYQSLMI